MYQLGLYQFLALPKPEKADLLWMEGTFIANSVEAEESYSLYALFGYYVEVTLKAGEIVDMIPFKQGYRFEKYLTQIDITGL